MEVDRVISFPVAFPSLSLFTPSLFNDNGGEDGEGEGMFMLHIPPLSPLDTSLEICVSTSRNVRKIQLMRFTLTGFDRHKRRKTVPDSSDFNS